MISWGDLLYTEDTKLPALVNKKKGMVVSGLKLTAWPEPTALATAEILKIFISAGLRH